MSSVPTETDRDRTRRWATDRRVLLGLLLATYACSFVDRIVVSVVGPALIRDLELSDLQFGLLGGLAFALFYSIFGLPLAWVAERRSRVNLISICVALWSVMTMLCGVAQSFWQLLVFRAGVGVGEAGCTPPAHSLISDHFEPGRRASALATYSMGVPLGVMIGGAAGGWLAQTFGWRVAFLALGAPGLLLALLVKVVLREPVRGQVEGLATAGVALPWTSVLRTLFANRTFLHLCAACTLTTVAANGINLFAPTHFVRTLGMGLAEVGLYYGLIVGVSGVVGLLIGGYAVDLAARADARWSLWIPALGVALASPLYMFGYAQTTPLATVVLVLIAGVSMSVYIAPTFAVAQNLVEPRMRASVSAVMLLSMNLFGQGVGPTLLGWSSDVLATRSFTGGVDYAVCSGGAVPNALVAACSAAAAIGLQRSMVGLGVVFLWGAVHFVLAARSVKDDLAVRWSR